MKKITQKNLHVAVITALVLMLSASIFATIAFSADNSKTDSSNLTANPSNENATIADQNEALTLNATLVSPLDAYEKTSFIKEDAMKAKTYAMDSKTISLYYSKSEISEGGNEADVYTDDKDTEYRFNSSGELFSLKVSEQTFLDSIENYVGDKAAESNPVDEETAVKIAVQSGKKLMGEKFNLVEFDRIVKDNVSNCYYVYFYQKLGSNGFARGMYCDVFVLPDGSVSNCSMGNYDDLLGFDESLLTGFTSEALYKDAGIRIADIYSKKEFEYEPIKTVLKNDNGNYYLEATFSVSHGSVRTSETFRYNLNSYSLETQ